MQENGKYTDYVSLNDVYGVNSRLKVYYCSGGLDSIQNLGKDDIDEAKERDVFTDLENGLGKLLSPYDANKDEKIQSTEISSITRLEVTEAMDLKDIYNLYSLERLIINGVQDVDLTGIENCLKLNNILFFKGSAKSYEPIGKLGGKLNKLFFYIIKDGEFQKLCSNLSNFELTGLNYLGFFNSDSWQISVDRGPWMDLNATDRSETATRMTELTDISMLNNFNSSTKLAVKYLWIVGSKIENLNGLDEFENLIY